jgi:ribosomal protein L16 Arg81 hydroxylase
MRRMLRVLVQSCHFAYDSDAILKVFESPFMKITDFDSLLGAGSTEEPPAPAVLTGRELEDLVSPMTSGEFINSHFSRAPLFAKGHPQKFDKIFSWGKLKQALSTGEKISDRRYNITAAFTGGEDSGHPRRMIEAQHNQVIELLNAGATVCITNIHMADPGLARWAQAIRAQLNFTGTVGVNCYVSPDASGLPMHYDKRVATTLQIAGKKRWKFSTEPAKAWPDTNEVYQGARGAKDLGKLPDELEFHEVELNPGDLLCLPAGTWHSARGMGHSLALNLYFGPRNLVDQLIPLLQNFSATNEKWRGGPPATAEKIQGNMPQAVSAYLRERLDEFHKMALEAIDEDALTVPWLNSLTIDPYTGWQPAPLLPLQKLTRGQRFSIAASSLRFIESGDSVIVPCDLGVLRFPVTLAPVLRRLSSAPMNFTIPEVLLWEQVPAGPSPDDVISCLKDLYANGILLMV